MLEYNIFESLASRMIAIFLQVAFRLKSHGWFASLGFKQDGNSEVFFWRKIQRKAKQIIGETSQTEHWVLFVSRDVGIISLL